jgi:hypothetical protein
VSLGLSTAAEPRAAVGGTWCSSVRALGCG